MTETTNPTNGAATAGEPAQRLPIFYESLAPLSSSLHAGHGFVDRLVHPFARSAFAIPITVDEFVMAQRFYPIVFGMGANAAPLALVGMANGHNLFIDEEGRWAEDTYVPAYVRRYPFMLAKLAPDAKELSLCFDDQSGYVVPAEGEKAKKLFEDGKPTELTTNILKFCEQFEQSIQRTQLFMNEISKLELLTEAEAQVQVPNMPGTTFRGFRMMDEKKVQDLRGDQARKFVQNGMLGLIYAHIFSLQQLRDLYARSGKLDKAA